MSITKAREVYVELLKSPNSRSKREKVSADTLETAVAEVRQDRIAYTSTNMARLPPFEQLSSTSMETTQLRRIFDVRVQSQFPLHLGANDWAIQSTTSA